MSYYLNAFGAGLLRFAAAVSPADTVSGSNLSPTDIAGTVSAADASPSFWEQLRTFNFTPTSVIIIALVLFALVMLGLELLRSHYVLSVNRKMITVNDLPENFDGTRLAVISDLHQMHFGEHNEELAKRIKREEPDYIMFVGDMGDAAKFDVNAFYDLLESLGEEIPVIVVPGSDDLRLGSGEVHKNFAKELDRAGAVMLNNSCAEMVSGDQKLYIYGFCQPLKEQKNVPAARWNYAPVKEADITRLLGNCPSDAPVILLAHNPKPFQHYRMWGANLVLSGYAHGGGVRLPLLGGLFSPDGGLHPQYSGGLYEFGGSKLFVTRGLGSSNHLRLFNAPEVAVLTIVRPGSKLIPVTAERLSTGAMLKKQLSNLGGWFKSEKRSVRDLADERLTQGRDFFDMILGRKRSRFAIAADAQKRRNTYVAPKGAKKKKKKKSTNNH